MSSLGTRLTTREELPHIDESGTPSSVTRRSNNDRLKGLLDSLGHLNKTGLIEDMKSVRGAYGGYSDMFDGRLALSNSEGGTEHKWVAIKRLRVNIFIGREEAFAKVCTTFSWRYILLN